MERFSWYNHDKNDVNCYNSVIIIEAKLHVFLCLDAKQDSILNSWSMSTTLLQKI